MSRDKYMYIVYLLFHEKNVVASFEDACSDMFLTLLIM